MSTNKKSFTMRMPSDSYDKIRVIAALNKRSVTNQIEYLCDVCIRGYEEKFGQIRLTSDTTQNIVQTANHGNNYYANGNVAF